MSKDTGANWKEAPMTKIGINKSVKKKKIMTVLDVSHRMK